MASTIHDERPSTSSYVRDTKNSSTSTRPPSVPLMAAPVPPQFRQSHNLPPYNSVPANHYGNLPRNIGYWQNTTSGGSSPQAFNPMPFNWTSQPPRNYLSQAPFYMQSNPPIPWNNYDYSYTRPPPHNMIPQTPTSWTPTQQAHTLKNPPIERDSRGSNHHLPHPPQTGPSESGDCWNNAVVAWEQQRTINNKVGLIVNERYRIVQNIDSGSYGTIFVAEDLKKNNERVAVKFDAASKDDHLKYEFEVYKSALYEDGCVKIEGFPRVYWFGNQFGHNVLVMELLGPPISSLFNFCERKFGLQTVISLGEQMIRRIKHLHQRGFIHRDVKPENFLMGLCEKETVCYLIDFGLARRYRYRDGRQLKHIPFRKGRNFVGTAKYASLNSHKNAELSRRDDVESLGYVLIELINGSLPWKKLKVRNAYSTKHQMYIKIRNMKEQVSWIEICPSMAEWMNYCKKLPFTDEPDYELLLKILRQISESSNNTTKSLNESMQSLTLDDDSRCSQCRQRETRAFKEAPGEASCSDNDNPIICNEKLGRERKLSKSASMSVVNSLDPQHSLSTIPVTQTYAESVSDSKTPRLLPLDDDIASVVSCRNCRRHRQIYLDERCAATGFKYSWQVWRQLTPELKFQYENRFSWTLPHVEIRDKRLLQPSLIYRNPQPLQQQAQLFHHPQVQLFDNFGKPEHSFPTTSNYANNIRHGMH